MKVVFTCVCECARVLFFFCYSRIPLLIFLLLLRLLLVFVVPFAFLGAWASPVVKGTTVVYSPFSSIFYSYFFFCLSPPRRRHCARASAVVGVSFGRRRDGPRPTAAPSPIPNASVRSVRSRRHAGPRTQHWFYVVFRSATVFCSSSRITLYST